MNWDKLFMSRAIELAKRGAGYVSSNPMVGAVIVHNNVIIGEGYHQRFGEAHAEVNAINSVCASDISKLHESTIYVSLEPCSHWGKTPPCCDLIIRRGISRVVVAMKDPFEQVCGSGIAKMIESGIEVKVGVLENEAKALNRRFITFNKHRRPYIILKWASTIDGFIDYDRDASKPAPWITNHACKVLVHRWRAEEDAIWVGKNTVLMDNPALTVREWFGKNPIRLTMDNSDQIDNRYRICNSEAETIIYKNKSIEQMLDDMYRRGIQSVFVEGGEKLLNYLIENGLFDEIREFVSPLLVLQIGKGSLSCIKAPLIINTEKLSSQKIGDVILNLYCRR